MIQSIKNAFKELEHVVWPTKKETRSYMTYTVSIIVIMTIFLSVVGFAFHEALNRTKQIINPHAKETFIQQQQALEEQNQQIQMEAAKEAKQETYEQFGLTGATVEETTTEAETQNTPPSNASETQSNSAS